MKGILLIFFVFLSPILIFVTMLLYGGMSSTLLKEGLQKANVYTKMSGAIQTMNTDGSDTDPAVTAFIGKWLTSSYIQKKTEEGIDISADWINGKTTTPPILSFKEIKDDIVTNNPQLITSIEEMSKEMKNQTPSGDTANPEETQQMEDMTKSMNNITSLAKSDFSIKLDQYLVGLKQFYAFIRIAQPVLAGFLILCLALIFILTKSVNAKMKWTGMTLMISGIWGFLVIFLTQFITQVVSQLLITTSNQFTTIVSPMVNEIIIHFAKQYTNYQGIVSIGMFIIAAVCFILASVSKTPIVSSAPKISKTPKKK